MRDILIVTVNYNSSRSTLALLQSLRSNAFTQGLPVCVVDNDSEPEDFARLQAGLRQDEHTVLKRNTVNYGFGLGNQSGCIQGSHHYIFFVNNDCLPDAECIKTLYDFMEQQPDAAWAVPQILSTDGVAQQPFDYLPSLATMVLGKSICSRLKPSSFPDRRKTYALPLRVPMGSGCAMFFRTQAFAQLGGFDPNLFLYAEEEDLAFRCRQANLPIYFVPAAKIAHEMGASTPRSPAVLAEFYTSYFYVLEKHLPFWEALLMKWLFRGKVISRFLRKKAPLPVLQRVFRSNGLAHSLRHQQIMRVCIDKKDI